MFCQQSCGTKEDISQCAATGNNDLLDTCFVLYISFQLDDCNLVWFVYLALKIISTS
jgi:hypothetical protein